MGYYSEYLDSQIPMAVLVKERQKQLQQIAKLRKRDVIVIAADLNKDSAPISLNYSDLVPFADQLSNLTGNEAIDVILETPGGSGEVAEDIVRALHGKYSEVAFIIPGWAKSAGTIMAMAGDEILMEPSSALGPIDAQLMWQGKVFSAEALLEGMEKIKREVAETGSLNMAYVPVLQGISPGELQAAENSQKFSQALVSDWLVKYKFKNWKTHSSTGLDVTDAERLSRAKDIAGKLCDHRTWLTHGRSLHIEDLVKMRLLITDYSKTPELAESIRRYFTLLHMAFEGSNIFKVFETPQSVIHRFVNGPGVVNPGDASKASFELRCNRCGAVHKMQASLGAAQPVETGYVPFPSDNKFVCKQCGLEINLTDVRKTIEAQSKKPIVP